MKATTKRFMKIMNDLFSAYVKDGKMDNYRIEENIFYISDKEDEEWVSQLFNVKTRTIVKVHEGDNVLDLLDKYKDVKDVYNKIKKACEDSGLVMVGSDVIKA